ncbi:DUF2024 family protein [Chitinophaga sp. S165]|uniref:DUF2024 family protein n=1 Tax=Chitinophaga sp. S165 TaxID=2135462 RepID=UPI000D70D5B0|nr:DUF2024 family protein [Chitinophaga sp. S165]PWV54324.1 uncharacterized protein DUF2024 [Chitinophaga sp. S165]
MKVAVWDTYVVKRNGETMHFDIIVPDDIKDEAVVHNMGKDYLSTKDQQGQPLTARECRLCHQEVASPEMVSGIAQKGYYIIEMEGC